MLLCALFQSAAVIRRFSGSENTLPSSGKDELPNCVVNAASKQGFVIYVDELEEKENYNGQVAEELESSLCELDTSAMTSNIHLLLDLSTGNSCYYSDVSTAQADTGWLLIMMLVVKNLRYNK